jgi:hypothetical protein
MLVLEEEENRGDMLNEQATVETLGRTHRGRI